MREFFRGWRRKSGCIMLAIACVFMIGWFRSQNNFDELQLFRGWKTTHFLMSFDERIGWSSVNDPNDNPNPAHIRTLPFSFQTQRRDPNEIMEIFDLLGIQWITEWRGFLSGTSASLGIQIWIVPYWSINIPLTALSAWLLLSKPQNSTPQIIREPIPAGRP